jgi:hypothetical protein
MRMAREWSGVERADSFDALVKALKDNLEDRRHIAEWRARRRECRESLMRIDGRGVSRIVETVRELIAQDGAPAAAQAASAFARDPHGASSDGKA